MSQITKMRSSSVVARSLPKYVDLLAGSVSALKTTAQFSLTHPPSSKSFQNITPHCRLLHPLFYFIYIFIPYTHTLVSRRINSRSSDRGLWVPYVGLPARHSSANPTPASGDVLRDRKAFSLSPLIYQIHTCTTVLISQIMSGREAQQEQRP